MKKIIKLLTKSNRWKHLIGGFIIGAGADSLYCAAYAGTGVAATLELKDKLWGGQWDWLDFAITETGVTLGFTLTRILI